MMRWVTVLALVLVAGCGTPVLDDPAGRGLDEPVITVTMTEGVPDSVWTACRGYEPTDAGDASWIRERIIILQVNRVAGFERGEAMTRTFDEVCWATATNELNAVCWDCLAGMVIYVYGDLQ